MSLVVMYPTYSFTIAVHDRVHQNAMTGTSIGFQAEPPSLYKFYDPAKGKTGCDEAMKAVVDALNKAGLEFDIRFTGYGEEP